MNPVVHFEMPAEDKRRMADFYTKVFGWQTKMLGPEMGGYVLVTTTESEEMTGMHGEPYEIPGVGWYVSIIDTEGNRVSMLQPTGM